MKRALALGLGLLALVAATPARADFCVQLNGGPFSGDLGFFRFKGKLPMKKGVIKGLSGRAAGLEPAFGTATVAKDGTFVAIGASFFIDGEQGQFEAFFFPPSNTAGTGGGSYGSYGTGSAVTAAIVSCTTEP